MVEAMEAVIITMAIMMAMDLDQIGLEETSITVFQKCLITDVGWWLSFPQHDQTLCTHLGITIQSH
jgi:hypothetical protein